MRSQDYVEYVYLRYLNGSEFDGIAGDRWIPETSMKESFRRALSTSLTAYGYDAGYAYDDVVDKVWNDFVSHQIIVFEGDEFAGSYARFSINPKDDHIKAVFAGSEVANRVKLLGDEALQRALAKIAETEGWGGATHGLGDAADDSSPEDDIFGTEVPASDRIVTLDHNQQTYLIEAVEEVIDGLQTENSVDGDSGLRQRFLGELRAGRELLKAQSLRTFLLYQTLVGLLNTLIEKYKGQVLGETAKKLLELLIEHVFGK